MSPSSAQTMNGLLSHVCVFVMYLKIFVVTKKGIN